VGVAVTRNQGKEDLFHKIIKPEIRKTKEIKRVIAALGVNK